MTARNFFSTSGEVKALPEERRKLDYNDKIELVCLNGVLTLSTGNPCQRALLSILNPDGDYPYPPFDDQRSLVDGFKSDPVLKNIAEEIRKAVRNSNNRDSDDSLGKCLKKFHARAFALTKTFLSADKEDYSSEDYSIEGVAAPQVEKEIAPEIAAETQVDTENYVSEDDSIEGVAAPQVEKEIASEIAREIASIYYNNNGNLTASDVQNAMIKFLYPHYTSRIRDDEFNEFNEFIDKILYAFVAPFDDDQDIDINEILHAIFALHDDDQRDDDQHVLLTLLPDKYFIKNAVSDSNFSIKIQADTEDPPSEDDFIKGGAAPQVEEKRESKIAHKIDSIVAPPGDNPHELSTLLTDKIFIKSPVSDLNLPITLKKNLRSGIRWSPFDHLTETKKYPEGRLLRSEIRERLKDTFEVFSGSDNGCRDGGHLGILDYIFPFPRLLCQVALSHINSDAAFIAANILTYPLIAIKNLAAFLLTLICSPFVFLAHICVMPAINELLNQIQKITLNVQSEEGQETEALLGVFLSKQGKGFDPIVAPLAKSDSNGSVQPCYQELGLWGNNGASILQLKAVIKITPKNRSGVKALLRTNIFNTTACLEKNNTDNVDGVAEVEKGLQPSPAQ